MAELLAPSQQGQTSLDFTLLATDNVTLLLKDGASENLPMGASATIQIKTADLNYMNIGQLTSGAPMQVLSGAGVYRVKTRPMYNLGVDKT